MLNAHADRTAVETLRRRLLEAIDQRLQPLIDRGSERDGGFIQGLQAALNVLDEIVKGHNDPQAKD